MHASMHEPSMFVLECMQVRKRDFYTTKNVWAGRILKFPDWGASRRRLGTNGSKIEQANSTHTNTHTIPGEEGE